MSDFLAHLRRPEVPDWLRLVYALVFLTTFIHAILSWGAWSCCPPAYGEPATFAHAVQTAGGWTLAAIAIGEVIITMVLIVPKVYYGIKNEGRAEGRAEGREEGRKEGRKEGREEGREEGRAVGRAEGKAEGKSEGIVAGVDATLEALREAGVDEATLRRAEDSIARRAWRNGL